MYNSHKAIVMPGSGTFAMESVARQLGTDEKVMVLRNGFFSYRWSHIFEMGKIPSEEIVLKAAPQEGGDGHPQYVGGGRREREGRRREEGRQRDGGERERERKREKERERERKGEREYLQYIYGGELGREDGG